MRAKFSDIPSSAAEMHCHRALSLSSGPRPKNFVVRVPLFRTGPRIPPVDGKYEVLSTVPSGLQAGVNAQSPQTFHTFARSFGRESENVGVPLAQLDNTYA